MWWVGRRCEYEPSWWVLVYKGQPLRTCKSLKCIIKNERTYHPVKHSLCSTSLPQFSQLQHVRRSSNKSCMEHTKRTVEFQRRPIIILSQVEEIRVNCRRRYLRGPPIDACSTSCRGVLEAVASGPLLTRLTLIIAC